jgi:hypothetical protein
VREINGEREWKRDGERVSEWERGRGREGRDRDRWLFGHAGWTDWECWVREIEGKREGERERMKRERLLSKREREWGGEKNRGEIRGRKREGGREGERGRERERQELRERDSDSEKDRETEGEWVSEWEREWKFVFAGWAVCLC